MPGTHNGPSHCVHGRRMSADNCSQCKALRSGVIHPEHHTPVLPDQCAWWLPAARCPNKENITLIPNHDEPTYLHPLCPIHAAIYTHELAMGDE